MHSNDPVVFVVETRSIRFAGNVQPYLACDYVHFASSQERAEDWILDQRADHTEKLYYAIVKAPIDNRHLFELVGYYDILGQKTTKERCMSFILR